MKVRFRVADKHQIECDWSILGLEKYLVYGQEIMPERSPDRRGSRIFKVGEAADRHEVEIRIESSRGQSVARAYVDGRLVVEHLISKAESGAWPASKFGFARLAVGLTIGGIVAYYLLQADHGAPRYLTLNMAGAMKEFGELTPRIVEYRDGNKKWPARNGDIELPPEGLVMWDGRHVFDLQRDGSVLLKVYDTCRPHEKHCKPGERYEVGQVSLRPSVNERGSIDFVCGNAPVRPGIRVIGQNRTTLQGHALPRECR